MDFKGKVVLVIEGEERIGKAVSLSLVSRGAKVIIAYTKSNRIINIPKAHLFNIDPLNLLSLKKVIAGIKKTFKSIDVLINYVNTEKTCSLRLDKEMKQDWESLFTVDLKGFYNCIEIVVPVMIKQGYGRIVNVADSPIQGHIRYLRMRNEITGFTKTLGRELAKKNIYMNAIVPGLIEGEDYSKLRRECGIELALYLPVQRPAKIEEIVEPILFLAKEEASYTFGETIRVDGGFAA